MIKSIVLVEIIQPTTSQQKIVHVMKDLGTETKHNLAKFVLKKAILKMGIASNAQITLFTANKRMNVYAP
jgi:SRSO17 transposase